MVVSFFWNAGSVNTEITDRRNANGWVCFDAVGWISALLPTAIVLPLGRALPGWVWMWAIAFALFIGAKWVTIQGLLHSGKRAGPGRLVAYGLLWPGMDLRAFWKGARP